VTGRRCRSRRASGPPAFRPCRARRGWRSTFPACRECPRDRGALPSGHARRGRRQGKRIRPRCRLPVAHAAMAAGAHGLCVATLERRWRFARPASRPPCSSCPGPARRRPRGRPRGHRAGRRRRPPSGRAGWPPIARARGRSRGRPRRSGRPRGDRDRLGRDGLAPDEAVAGPGACGRYGDPFRRGRGSHLQAPGDVARTARQVRALRGRGWTPWSAPGVQSRTVTCSHPADCLPSSGTSVGAPPFDGLRVAWRSTDQARGTADRPGSRRHRCGAPAGPLASRPAGARDGPAAGEGVGYGPTFITAPDEPDRDAARRVCGRLGPRARKPRRRDRPGRAVSPWSGPSRWTP